MLLQVLIEFLKPESKNLTKYSKRILQASSAVLTEFTSSTKCEQQNSVKLEASKQSTASNQCRVNWISLSSASKQSAKSGKWRQNCWSSVVCKCKQTKFLGVAIMFSYQTESNACTTLYYSSSRTQSERKLNQILIASIRKSYCRKISACHTQILASSVSGLHYKQTCKQTLKLASKHCKKVLLH